MGTALRAACVWLVLGGFYLFLAGEVSAVELIAGLVCASAGAALAVGLFTVSRRRYRFRPAPRALLRPLAALFVETISVGRQLVAASFTHEHHLGGFVRQPFDPGTDDPTSAGRRAIAVLGISLAPGSFVVRGERSDTMILHALPQKPASPDTRWPA